MSAFAQRELKAHSYTQLMTNIAMPNKNRTPWKVPATVKVVLQPELSDSWLRPKPLTAYRSKENPGNIERSAVWV